MKRGGRPSEPQAPQTERLLDLRDNIQNARDLAAASYLASSALGAGSERSALCAVTNAVREALECALQKLDRVIASPG